MKRTPLISIIIPAYNSEKYLRQSINSALQQTYQNLEIIVIDDGSSDTTKHILDTMSRRHHQLKVIHTDNRGVSAARNLGIKRSHGRYITFLDADDFLTNDCVEYLYQLLQKNKTDMAVSTVHNKFTSYSKQSTYDTSPTEKVVTGEGATILMLYYKLAINPGGKLFDAKEIKQHNLYFNEGLKYGEDFNFNIENFQHARRIALGDRPVYNYRLDNQNSVMTNFNPKMIKDNLTAQRCINTIIKTKTKAMRRALVYAKWHTQYDCFNTLIGTNAIPQYQLLYRNLRHNVKKGAHHNFFQPIPFKDKIKVLLYSIAPTTTAKLINHFFERNFTKCSQS